MLEANQIPTGRAERWAGMKRAKYKELTIFEFDKMLDEFLNEPEEALSVTYFKIRVKRKHSTGQRESLRIEDVK